MALIAPSILSSNFAELGKALKMLDQSEADWIHIDVMDGRFVPNISFGMPIVRDIRPLTKKFFDVHLMIENPENYAEDFKKAGADGLTVHAEACTHLHRNIQQIRSLDMKVGVSLNPHMPVSYLEDVIQDLDLVLIMSVNPGFGGQKFIEQSLIKVKQCQRLIKEHNSNALIEVDGGINLENAKSIIDSGADVLVAGNTVFSSPDPSLTISELKKIS